MQGFRKIFTGFFARLMAAGWLFQVIFPALCCCCCLDNNSADAGDDFDYPITCCCQIRSGCLEVADHDGLPQLTAGCRGIICEVCESFGCLRGADTQLSATLRHQLGGREKLAVHFTLSCPGILFSRNSHCPSESFADVCADWAAISATERCVCLQRLVL